MCGPALVHTYQDMYKSFTCRAAGIPLVDDDQTITLASGSVKIHFGNFEDLWHEQVSSLYTLN